MTETQNPQAPSRRARRAFRLSRTMTRAMAASGIVIGVLAVAAPSWAGPLMGC